MARKTKDQKAYIKDLKVKQGVIDERVDFLTDLKNEIQETGGASMIKLGGLVDDLTLLNPFTQEKIVPLLLELYEAEKLAFDHLVYGLN